MVHYKLTYFSGRGAAEIIRQIFAAAKVEFEDVRITQEQWPELKQKQPFGQLPVLEEDGKVLAQSLTIARYLARKFHLAGKNAWEEAVVDSLVDLLKDVNTEIRPYFVVAVGFQEGDLDKLKAEVLIPAAQKALTFITKFLKENGTGFLVGDGLTWVDLGAAEMTALLASKAPEALDNFPEVKAHLDKIHLIPEIKHWRETRPKTNF